MNAESFDELMKQVSRLTLYQREVLRKRLDAFDGQHQALAIIEPPSSSQPCSCPYCQDSDPDRHGQVSGVHRYRCQSCRCTINALTGTTLARVRKKDEWLGFSEALVACEPRRQAAVTLAVHHTPRCAGGTGSSSASRRTRPQNCRASWRPTSRIFKSLVRVDASGSDQSVDAVARPAKRVYPAIRCALWWHATVPGRPRVEWRDADK